MVDDQNSKTDIPDPAAMEAASERDAVEATQELLDPSEEPLIPPADASPEGGGSEDAEVLSEALSVEGLLEKLVQASEEVEKYRDAALRADAEAQNVRRRAERDVEHAHKFALERFLENLLPIVDSLEKAIEVSSGSDSEGKEEDPMLEGVKICFKMFMDVMTRANVAVIDPHGEPFDPQVHQAMSMVENPDVEPNSVVMVMQKGYQLNGRLVRPAMVMVSK